MRRIPALLPAVAVLVLAGCGGGDPAVASAPPAPPPPPTQAKLVHGSPLYDKILARGNKMTIGLAVDRPGLAERGEQIGEFTGFEVEIGRRIAKGLGISPDSVLFKPLPASLRADAVRNGDVDIQLGEVTPESAKAAGIGVAGPYLVSTPALLEPVSESPSGSRGTSVCAVRDSPVLAALPQGDFVPRTADSLASCLAQLTAGQVMAVADDGAVLAGYAADQPNTFRVVSIPGPSTEYDIGVVARDKPFRAKLTDIVREAVADGSWQRIYTDTLGRSGVPGTPPQVR